MRVNQVGEPRVCLSFDRPSDKMPGEADFVSVSLEVKIDERSEEDGSVVAEVCCPGGRSLVGRAIEKRTPSTWLVFRIPCDLCPEGKSLRFRAVVDEDVLWQEAYRVVWRGRFPGLVSTS